VIVIITKGRTMRISSRDLRKLINEELRRSIGLREIRVASGPEAASSGAPMGADEDEEEGEADDKEETPAGEEEDDEEVSDGDRYDDYLTLVRDITTLMNVEDVLKPQLPAVLVGLEHILKNGKASKYAVAVTATLVAGDQELNEDQLALAVIAALKKGRSAGAKKTDSHYFMTTLNFDFDWWWDTKFEDKLQDVKFVESLVKFIESK